MIEWVVSVPEGWQSARISSARLKKWRARLVIAWLLVVMTGLTSARAAAERQIKDSGFTACRDEATMNKFEQFARESDTTALAIALMDATRRGQCIALNKGESVFVYESSGSGHVKIRRRGDPAEYWANKEAVFP